MNKITIVIITLALSGCLFVKKDHSDAPVSMNRPDYIITGITLSPSVPGQMEDVLITTTIKNVGDSYYGELPNVTGYFSGYVGPVVGIEMHSPKMAINHDAEFNLTCHATTPSGIGTTLRVTVSPVDGVVEQNSNNNAMLLDVVFPVGGSG